MNEILGTAVNIDVGLHVRLFRLIAVLRPEPMVKLSKYIKLRVSYSKLYEGEYCVNDHSLDDLIPDSNIPER